MDAADSGYEDIDPYELIRRSDELGAQVIDVREPWEYQAGHVPGAILMPLSTVPERIDEIADGAVLVCATGSRSGYACAWLAAHGKRDLANLENGTEGWILHGLETE